MSLPITGFYTSILGIILVYLAILVIRERRAGRVSLGDGNVEELPYLQRSSRAFGNFTEYVPMAVLLLAIAELNAIHHTVLHGCAMLLVFGRLAHAYGLRHHPGPSWQRVWGMMATFACIIALSVCNLFLLY